MRALAPILLVVLASCASDRSRFLPSFPVTERERINGAIPVHGLTTTFGGHVPVFVAASDTPQVLHLTSFGAAIWHVYLFPGANVATVYVSGFEPQRLVIRHSRQDSRPAAPKIVDLGQNLFAHRTLSFGPPTRARDALRAAYRAEVRATTGLELTDFQGLAAMRPGEALAVPAHSPPDPAQIAAHFPRAFARDTRTASAEAGRIRRDMATLIRRGDLPSRLPLFNTDMNLEPGQAGSWPLLPSARPTTAAPRGSNCGMIQLGTAGDDDLKCDAGRGFAARTLWVLSGPGRDILSDHRSSSQLMSGGPGDDLINADLGNDVFYFGPGWGDDVLAMRCHPIEGDSFRRGKPPHPIYQHSRYIVFGRGISPAELVWASARELVHRRTGSRIRFADGVCASFLAVEPGEVPAGPP